MFQNLTDKLANAFRRFRSKGKLTEADVREGMREVKLALLEADVSFTFKQTGAYFIKDGVKYHIPRKFQHKQSQKAGISYYPQTQKQENHHE